ncbi:hypothetical protein Ciccas_008636 [Cichlidogyrus casuarinus]|uniref:G-protein coupled receptors family 1 profile domain-containing protein n=1 Tax=Cichlidogyrus casuarinus TaxID=1844966 RepID=A0ABD2PZE8_9PLAT
MGTVLNILVLLLTRVSNNEVSCCGRMRRTMRLSKSCFMDVMRCQMPRDESFKANHTVVKKCHFSACFSSFICIVFPCLCCGNSSRSNQMNGTENLENSTQKAPSSNYQKLNTSHHKQSIFMGTQMIGAVWILRCICVLDLIHFSTLTLQQQLANNLTIYYCRMDNCFVRRMYFSIFCRLRNISIMRIIGFSTIFEFIYVLERIFSLLYRINCIKGSFPGNRYQIPAHSPVFSLFRLKLGVLLGLGVPFSAFIITMVFDTYNHMGKCAMANRRYIVNQITTGIFLQGSLIIYLLAAVCFVPIWIRYLCATRRRKAPTAQSASEEINVTWHAFWPQDAKLDALCFFRVVISIIPGFSRHIYSYIGSYMQTDVRIRDVVLANEQAFNKIDQIVMPLSITMNSTLIALFFLANYFHSRNNQITFNCPVPMHEIQKGDAVPFLKLRLCYAKNPNDTNLDDVHSV